MNLTISIEEQVVERAREVAKSQGTSLQGLIRRYLETLGGTSSGEEVAETLLDLMKSNGGHSKGARIRREDAYEGRL